MATTPPGGIINAVSKRPTEERIREVLLEAGTRGRYRAAGDISGQLDENGEWLGRFIGSYSEGDGELDETRERRYFFSPSLTWRPSNDTSITVLGHYQRDPESGSYGGVPAWGTVLPNPNGRIGMRFYDGDPDLERSNREHYSIGYLAEHRFNEYLTVRQNARYLHTQGEYRSVYGSAVTPDYRQLARSIYGTDADIDIFTIDNQVQVNADTGPLRHTLLAGLDYYRTLTDSYTGSTPYTALAGRARNQDLFNPVYQNQGSASGLASAPIQQSAFQPARRLFAGSDQDRPAGAAVSAAGSTGRTARRKTARSRPARRTTTSRQTDDAFTGRVGAVYLFDNGLAPYASYSESFEPQSGTDRFAEPVRADHWPAVRESACATSRRAPTWRSPSPPLRPRAPETC
jgi:iron complex outermembrane receptor protein